MVALLQQTAAEIAVLADEVRGIEPGARLEGLGRHTAVSAAEIVDQLAVAGQVEAVSAGDALDLFGRGVLVVPVVVGQAAQPPERARRRLADPADGRSRMARRHQAPDGGNPLRRGNRVVIEEAEDAAVCFPCAEIAGDGDAGAGGDSGGDDAPASRVVFDT